MPACPSRISYPRGLSSALFMARFSAAAAIALVLAGPVCLAQKDAGAIAGTVRDSSGAVVAGVNVTATDVDHGATLTTTSNASGEYVLGPLKVGNYVVSLSKQGFAGVRSTPITLQVQQRVVFDITLSTGAVSESVTVTDTTAQLQTETSDLGQVLDSRQISNLPLNGRNFAQLALLSPGTAPAAPGSRDQSSYGFSANGARSLQNNFLLDGIDNNSNLPDLLNGSSYVIEPPVESLEEFKVQTSSYTAEFGRGNGAVINAVTHSGTNDLHGALYEFFRNEALDARNWYDLTRQPYKQNQFGGTVGGPVVVPHLYNGRGRSFFFTDYEGFRSIDSQPIPAIVPTAAQRGGDFSSQLDTTSQTLDANSGAPIVDCNGQPTYAGEIFNTRLTQQSSLNADGNCGVPFGYASGQPVNVIPGAVIDPLASRIAALYPAANVTSNPAYNFVSSPKRVINRNNFDLRLDQQFGVKDNTFARYSFETVPTNIPAVFGPVADGGDFFSGIANTHYHSLAIGDTHLFTPRLVNEFRFGFNRIYSNRLQPGFNSTIAQQIGFPGIPAAPSNGGLPQLTFSDVSTIGSSLFLPTRELQNTYIFSENLNWVIGNHSLRFGAEIDRNEFAIYQPAEPRGTLNFSAQFTDNAGSTIGNAGSGFASFLLGIADTGSISNAINIDYFRPSWNLYAQDDWKVNSKLTLNYGLRYELYQTVKERNNHVATYDLNTQTLIVPKGQPTALTPNLSLVLPNVSATGSDGLIKPDTNNFAPRVGLALSTTSKSVVRAGYGFFYGGSESGPYSNPSPGYNPPFYKTNSYSANCSAASANPDPAQTDCSIPGLSVLANGFPADALSDPNTPLLYSLDPHLVTPYVQQYQLSAEYQMPSNTLFTVAYAGSHGAKLYTFFNGNEATPSADGTAAVAPRRPIPGIDAPIQWFRSSGKSNYNALEFSLARSARTGLSLLAAYTYAHGMDNASAANLGSQNGGDFRDFRHPEAEYANSDTDVRHRFTFSYLYPLPVGRGQRYLASAGRAADAVLGHWQAGGIVTLSTGNWYTATDAVNFSNVPDGGGNVGSSQRPNFAGNPNGKPCLSGTYFNTCAFSDPSLGSFGNVNRNTIRGPGTEEVDFSLFKLFELTERLHLEFRSEFFNLFNHYNPLFAPAAASATVGATVRDTPGFGFLTAAQAPRQIQLSLKLSY